MQRPKNWSRTTITMFKLQIQMIPCENHHRPRSFPLRNLCGCLLKENVIYIYYLWSMYFNKIIQTSSNKATITSALCRIYQSLSMHRLTQFTLCFFLSMSSTVWESCTKKQSFLEFYKLGSSNRNKWKHCILKVACRRGHKLRDQQRGTHLWVSLKI